MTSREKYINAITDHAVRAWVYAEARRILPTVGARCALTQYLFLVKAGVLKDKREARPLMTSQLEHALLTEVKGCKRITNPTQLRRGDVCFSRNCNSVPGPDHVYAFHTGLPSGAANVVDNYAVGPHPRNITAAKPKTPFDYALRLP
jgi:hypothetical protein